jgi:hypothetical protein
MGCFFFSLNLFRKRCSGPTCTPMPMLNVQESDDDEPVEVVVGSSQYFTLGRRGGEGHEGFGVRGQQRAARKGSPLAVGRRRGVPRGGGGGGGVDPGLERGVEREAARAGPDARPSGHLARAGFEWDRGKVLGGLPGASDSGMWRAQTKLSKTDDSGAFQPLPWASHLVQGGQQTRTFGLL